MDSSAYLMKISLFGLLKLIYSNYLVSTGTATIRIALYQDLQTQSQS